MYPLQTKQPLHFHEAKNTCERLRKMYQKEKEKKNNQTNPVTNTSNPPPNKLFNPPVQTLNLPVREEQDSSWKANIVEMSQGLLRASSNVWIDIFPLNFENLMKTRELPPYFVHTKEHKMPYPGLAGALANFPVQKVHFQTDSAMS